jgi:hypothetical protein
MSSTLPITWTTFPTLLASLVAVAIVSSGITSSCVMRQHASRDESACVMHHA